MTTRSRWDETRATQPRYGRPIMDRIWDRTMPIPESGCYVWLGRLNTDGYGLVLVAGKPARVHRVAYKILTGPIPEGLILDHKCRVRSCWRPEHLEPVTSRENALCGSGVTAINAKKTHCHKGHALSGANLGMRENGRWRYCRECMRAYGAEYYEANK